MALAAWAGFITGAGSPDVRAQGPKTNSRAPEFEVVVEKNVMIPMRDGVRLAADIFRPARDGKPAPGRFPTLLTRTPYDKDGAAATAATTPSAAMSPSPTTCAGRYASEGPGG